MQNLDPTGQYTNDEVKAALAGVEGSRGWSFRYERLFSNNEYIEDIDYIQSCTVSNNAFADIKRIAKFTMLDTGNLNFLSDRIKPYVRLTMPKDGTKRRGYVEWPQGVFLLSTPARTMENGSTVVREVEAYDQLLALKESSFDYRYSIAKDSNCVVALQELISGVSRRNLVLNPSFEHAEYPYVESTLGTGPIPGMTPNLPVKLSGSKSLAIVSSATSQNWRTRVNMQIDPALSQGRNVYYQFSVQSSAAGVAVTPYTVNDGLITSTGKLTQLPAGEWVQVGGNFFMPNTPSDDARVCLEISFGSSATSKIVYIDNAIAETNKAVGTYFDGSTREQGDESYAWIGEAHNSASLATSKAFNITPSNQTFKESIEWEPGTTKLQIVNDILSYINYESAWYDENGVFIGRPYVTPAQRGSEFTYATDATSVITDDNIEQSLDIFSVPNKWILVVSQPESEPLVASYVNSNPLSPTSTVARGREIVDYRAEQEASDLVTLKAKAERLAFEASQVYEQVSFSTGLMPFHSNNDVYTLTIDGLAIDTKYSESSWDMELSAGASMAHQVRKITNL